MKLFLYGISFFLLSAGIFGYEVNIFFTPSHKTDRAILSILEKAQETIYVASYSIAWQDLIQRIQDNKDVDIRVIVDMEIPFILPTGMVKVDSYSRLFHPKFITVDGRYLIVGSGNFTPGNMHLYHNNFIIIEDRAVAEFFNKKFLSWWNDESVSDTYSDERLDVYFSPENDSERVIKDILAGARESIHFALYHFTSEEIAKALIKKQQEGVSVYGIIERGSIRPHSVFNSLQDFGCGVRQSSMAGFLHDKFFVVDGKVVITGSYNPTEAAKRNVECLLVLKDQAAAESFLREWKRLWRWHSL